MDNVDSEINEIKIKRKNFDLLKFPDNVPKGSSEDVIPHCLKKTVFITRGLYISPKRKSIYGFNFSLTFDYSSILLPIIPPSGPTHTRIFPNSVRIHNIVYWLHFCSHPINLWLFRLDFMPCNFPPNLSLCNIPEIVIENSYYTAVNI